MGKKKAEQPMDVIAQGICRCGGSYLVTRARDENRDRVRHREPVCEYFLGLSAPEYLHGIAQWKANTKQKPEAAPRPNPFLRKIDPPKESA